MKKAPAVYRLLTGPDDAAFCRRVSEALAQDVIVAPPVVWPSHQGDRK